MKPKLIGFLVLLVIGLVVLFNSAYVVTETEQVIITELGAPVGEPITEAGLHFKIPFVQKVNRLEKRFLPWDGPANEMPTKEKTYIIIDTFARWRISDPKEYFISLRDQRRALSRLDDILGSETRNAVANHAIIEIVRTSTDRQPVLDEDGSEVKWEEIKIGRSRLEQQIIAEAAPKLKEFGIELLDLRFKRINYSEVVRRDIYQSMISERQKERDRYRSEGQGEAAEIKGKMTRELRTINSSASMTVKTIEGEADANVTRIYAEAYNQSPESIEFYSFLRTLETYKEILNSDTSVILTTDSPLFQLLKTINPEPLDVKPEDPVDLPSSLPDQESE